VSLQTYQDVLGANLRRLRQERELRQDDLAARARGVGLSWTQQTVAAIEGGRRALSVGELLLLQSVLEMSLTELLPELLAADEDADVEGAVLSPDGLMALAAGTDESRLLLHALWPEEYGGGRIGAVMERRDRQLFDRYRVSINDAPQVTAAEHGDAERKAARQLNVRPLEVAVASWSLWGHSLTDERDTRLGEQNGEGDARARRGHITRQLLDELQAHIKDNRRKARRKK
jgi:transcriptional regulator with XRE-family HTH domain